MDTLKNATGMAQPTEEQKKEAYNKLPEEQKKKQSYSEWAAQVYAVQYERWMPWIEDQYLRWFGKGDNKASYATKGSFLPYPPFISFLTNTPQTRLQNPK
jgi:hypothetical protein